jgi:hypothetical protein
MCNSLKYKKRKKLDALKFIIRLIARTLLGNGVAFGFLLLIAWAYGMPDFGALDGILATAIVVYADYLGCLFDHPRRADREKIHLNDTARRSHRLRPRHLVDRHMGRDGTSTLAVAPRGHYCGGGDIGRCRVVNESPAIKPGIPMTSSANDLAASLSSRAQTAGSPRWRSVRRERKEGRRRIATGKRGRRGGFSSRADPGPRWRVGDCEQPQ